MNRPAMLPILKDNQSQYSIIILGMEPTFPAVVGVRAMGNVCRHYQQQEPIFDLVEI